VDSTPTPAPLQRPAPTGIAYDPLDDALLVTDPDANTILRIPRSRLTSEWVYRYSDSPDESFPPGFDGIAVAPDGQIYVTALDQKGVATFSGSEPYAPGSLAYVAGNFRGPSDLAFTPDGRLIVTNFDSTGLVQPGVLPQLPFALDALTFE
jgi:DNA-binding beta-propeller fold protein YncE